MRLSYIIYFFFLSTHAFSQTQINSFDHQGLKTGYWTATSGALFKKGEYIAGKPEGLWQSYHFVKTYDHLAEIAYYIDGL